MVRARGPAPGPKGEAEDGDWVCLGMIVRAHGVRGEVRIRPFTDEPGAVAAYGPLTDRATGRAFELKVMKTVKGMVIARIDGIEDRDAAQALAGTELWVPRATLPEAGAGEAEGADVYYHHDLVGLRAVSVDGRDLGRVVAVQNFGAGDILEIAPAGGTGMYVPFTAEVVPEVDLAVRRITVDAPPGLFDEDGGSGHEPGAADEDDEGNGR